VWRNECCHAESQEASGTNDQSVIAIFLGISIQYPVSIAN
jgi:hypothetical protein